MLVTLNCYVNKSIPLGENITFSDHTHQDTAPERMFLSPFEKLDYWLPGSVTLLWLVAKHVVACFYWSGLLAVMSRTEPAGFKDVWPLSDGILNEQINMPCRWSNYSLIMGCATCRQTWDNMQGQTLLQWQLQIWPNCSCYTKHWPIVPNNSYLFNYSITRLCIVNVIHF